MINFDLIVQVLQERALEGDPPTALARVVARIAKDEFKPMTFVASFRLAFGIPIQELHESASWVGFGFEDVEDQEFIARLSSHIDAWRKSQRL